MVVVYFLEAEIFFVARVILKSVPQCNQTIHSVIVVANCMENLHHLRELPNCLILLAPLELFPPHLPMVVTLSKF